jgi:hypothetical protein
MAHQPVLTARTLLTSLIAISIAGTATAMLIGAPATAWGAPPQDPIPPRPDNWGYQYGATQPGRGGTSSGQAPGASGSPVSRGDGSDGGPERISICGSWRLGIQVCDPIPLPGEPPTDPSEPTVSPVQLAEEAWDRLPIPEPEVRTAPPRGSDGLVGLPHWFWVTNWQSHTDRVEAGAVWAEVTARPTSMTINPQPGQSPVTCDGPGRAYDRTRSAASQSSECSYTFVRSSAGLPQSAYRVTVTVTWGGTWRGSDGSGGALPVITRSAAFPARVAEGQAVAGG